MIQPRILVITVTVLYLFEFIGHRCVLGTSQVQWTFYTVAKTWNEGQLVCWTLGGRLASPRTVDDKAAMDYLLAREPWKSGKVASRTLFMDMGRGEPEDEIRWSDCGDVFTVWRQGYDSTDDGCAGVLPAMFGTNSKISDSACYDQERQYICEVEVSPTCPYETVEGRPSNTNGELQGNIRSDAECRKFCTNNDTCRAYTFDGECTTFTSPDSMVYEGGANIDPKLTGQTHYKKCYLSSTVDLEPELTSPRSFTPFPFGCQAEGPPATVFSVFSDPVSWNIADSACSALNASMAVFDGGIKFEVASALWNESSLGPHWIGYQHDTTEAVLPLWNTGENVAQNVTPAEPITGSPLSCGTLDLGSEEYRLDRCDTPMPYVCQHFTGQCHFVVTHGHTASSGFTDRGPLKMSACYDLCEASRSAGQGGTGCYAFVTHFPDQTSSKSCLTLNFESWEESFTSADSWMADNPDMSLWRFTCITVALNNYTKTVQDESVTTVSSSTAGTTAESVTTQPTTIESVTTQQPTTDTTTSIPSTQQTDSTSNPTTENTLSTETGSDVSLSTQTSDQTSNPSTQNLNSDSITIPQTTNSATQTSTNGGLDLCRCPCNGNLSALDPNYFLEELADLHVPADSTGSAYRKKNSIMDDRPTSNGVGTVACVFLGCVLAILVSFDVINFWITRKRDFNAYYNKSQ